MTTEAFIREARMVTLSFYVDDLSLKQYADVLVERRSAKIAEEYPSRTRIQELRSHATDAYFEMGIRYFRRYALSNMTIFMNDDSQSRYNHILEEMILIEEVIAELREEVRFGEKDASELGEYLVYHIRLNAVKDSIEAEMRNALNSQYFRSHILPDIARTFYKYQKERKKQRTLGIAV